MSGPSDRPRVVLIAGPTASGKSAHAIELATREGGTIVNADAAQVYHDLAILTARPTPADEARVPHRLYGYRDAALPFSAAEWAADARTAIMDILREGRLPIVVGGTGLYLRTLLDGIAPVPTIDPVVREEVRRLSGPAARVALERDDPVAAARLHPNDAGRTTRALEVVRSTGQPLAAWQAVREGGIRGEVRAEWTLLDPPVGDLYARCDARVSAMVAAGALGEVQRLLTRGLDPALPAMRSIGVRQFGRYLLGEIGLQDSMEMTRQATRQYAKRQRTWFRHQVARDG